MFEKKTKRVLINLLLSLLMLSPPVWAGPDIKAESYILMDFDTGSIISSKNADLRLPPASLTKIFSTYLYFNAIKNKTLSLNEMVHVSREAWGSNVVGSKMFIEVDTQVSVSDLLHGVIVQSGNDASIALAEAIAGDEKVFAELMNEEAKRLGLKDSRFQNATGLPAKQHYSSARDVASIVRAMIKKFPELYKLYSVQEFTYNNITQSNRNSLLTKFVGADGVKTGYTKAAGYCLVSSAVQNGRRLISVVMKTKSKRARAAASIKLLNYGFKLFDNVLLFDKDDIRSLPVTKGQAIEVKVSPLEKGLFTTRRQNSDLITEFVPTTEVLSAPISVGDVLGTISVRRGDTVIQKTPVVAIEGVLQKGYWDSLIEDIKVNYLGHPVNEQQMLSEW